MNVLAGIWGSTITPELIKFCNEAGGVPKVFVSSCTNSCSIFKLSKKIGKDQLRCLTSMTADCDCGPDKCLEKDKCIQNPID